MADGRKFASGLCILLRLLSILTRDPAGFYYPVRAGAAYRLEHGVALKRRHYLCLW